ncbi:hypothetical protein FXB38_02645, partial [Bradyrhizobium cytisi]
IAGRMTPKPRCIGYIHHRFMPGQTDLSGTIDHHLAILAAVAGRRVEDAVKASDQRTFLKMAEADSVHRTPPLKSSDRDAARTCSNV